LAKIGKSRDRKRNTVQVNYGLVANKDGCPVSVDVYDGNTGDPSTLMGQVHKAQEDFGINDMVLVGDRGMITQKQIDELKGVDGIGWITALKTGAIRKLVDGGALQLDLFDERNLFEFAHDDFPGERLVACRNPALARKREHKRESMLEATEKELEKVCAMVERGTLKGKDKIGVRVGKVINKYKMAKHVVMRIENNDFSFEFDEKNIAAEAAIDGIYVIRTCVSKKTMSKEDAVRNYKNLTNVERAFRSLKSIDLMVRPIRHRTEDRVRAHIFLSMLAYYVQRYMLEALRPLLFADGDQDAKATRDPVAPAKRSAKALEKVQTKTLEDGTKVHSLRTLLHHMSTITRDECVQKLAGNENNTFVIDTKPNPKQQRVHELLGEIRL
jgi:transposase